MDSEERRKAPATTVDAREQMANAWGDPISEERQRELESTLALWNAETDHGKRSGPFDAGIVGREATTLRSSFQLTGADVFWLAVQTLAGDASDREAIAIQLRVTTNSSANTRLFFNLSELNLQGADLHGARLEEANLRGAHLEKANLQEAQLARADLHEAHLEQANLRQADLSHAHANGVHLERSFLRDANLSHAQLQEAHFEKAQLANAQLMDASMWNAVCDGAVFHGAHLRSANLQQAKLTEAELQGADLSSADLRRAELTKAQLTDAHLEGADLYAATLENAYLRNACLHDSKLVEANLREAILLGAQGIAVNCQGANLSGADLREAQLTRADFTLANLTGADCSATRLDAANLHQAILRGTNFSGAVLEASCLDEARLEGARLQDALLGKANLRRAAFDEETNLQNADMCDAQGIGPWLADVRWGGVNLAVVRWGQVQMLADEECIEHDTAADGTSKHHTQLRDELEAAIRANRQLAIALQQEGLEEASITFTGRTQGLQRKLYWRRGNYIQWFSSLCLDGLASTLAGYGYRPLRSVVAYLGTVAAFTVVYYIIGQLMLPHLSFLGALVFSIASFHGRGFFPSPEHASLDHPLVMAAAIEAVIGLIVEITFIAVFTKRFFFGH